MDKNNHKSQMFNKKKCCAFKALFYKLSFNKLILLGFEQTNKNVILLQTINKTIQKLIFKAEKFIK